jgi:F-type H+-transporting ATPase subunit epsilon
LAGQSTFSVDVLTPEGEVFGGEVVQLSTRTVDGELGVLANHVPVLAGLKPNRLRLRISDSEVHEFAQSHGVLQVFANHAQVLLEEAIPVDQLDLASLKEDLADAKQRSEDPEAGEAALGVAERDLERITAFIAIAKGE